MWLESNTQLFGFEFRLLPSHPIWLLGGAALKKKKMCFCIELKTAVKFRIPQQAISMGIQGSTWIGKKSTIKWE